MYGGSGTSPTRSSHAEHGAGDVERSRQRPSPSAAVQVPVAPGKVDALPDPRAAAHEGLPLAVVALLEQQQLEPPAARPAPAHAGRHDARVVQHQQVARAKQPRQRRHGLRARAPRAGVATTSSRAAVRSGAGSCAISSGGSA